MERAAEPGVGRRPGTPVPAQQGLLPQGPHLQGDEAHASVTERRLRYQAKRKEKAGHGGNGVLVCVAAELPDSLGWQHVLGHRGRLWSGRENSRLQVSPNKSTHRAGINTAIR